MSNIKITLRLAGSKPLSKSFPSDAPGSELQNWARASVLPHSTAFSLTVGKSKLKQKTLDFDAGLRDQIGGGSKALALAKVEGGGSAKLVAPLEASAAPAAATAASAPADADAQGGGGSSAAAVHYKRVVVAATDRSTWSAHLQALTECDEDTAAYFVGEARVRRMQTVDQCVSLFLDHGGVVPEPEAPQLPTGIVHTADDAEALREIIDAASAEGKLVIVDQWASWCGPCQRMKPIFKALAAEYTDCVFVEVDSDQYQLPGVTSLPTFQGHKGGAIVDTVIGADKGKLQAMIMAHRK